MLQGNWEEWTIKVDEPPTGLTPDETKRAMEAADLFEKKLAKLIDEFKKNAPRLTIAATDCEGQKVGK